MRWQAVFVIVGIGLCNPQELVGGSPQLATSPLNARSASDGAGPLFATLSVEATGVEHRQTLDWSRKQGILYYTGFACGGVAVGDVDGNGLPDLLLLGGAEPNRLYLQTAPWKFDDRTQAAGLAGDADDPFGGDGWSAGAALFDVDNDGDLDIYICNYDAANQLYVNRGDATFVDRAADYGLAIVDASLMPSVCDYDRDGDLDIYLAVNRYMDEQAYQEQELFYTRDGQDFLRPAMERLFAVVRHPNQARQVNMWIGRPDRLLRNNGPGRPFTDVTDDALQVGRADTLSATWWDFDHDQWPDLYVCNDLAAPDALYRNRGDGTFENVAHRSLPHTPWSAMGSSAGDVNGDGLVDFLAADMAFRTHFKDKVFMGNMSAKFDNIRYFPGDQLMRNALFINTGTPYFQEAAYAAGLASTDWTWTAKLADFDNDSRLDAFFTNGTPVSLSAPEALLLSNTKGVDTTRLRRLHAELPPVAEQNVAFRNVGDLAFADVSADWGLDFVGMSYAAAHADLDRDGDLDLVVANLDDHVAVYRNDQQSGHALLVELQGAASNRNGVGAELTVETTDETIVRQAYPVSGYLTCQESLIHFGLGDATRIERLTVAWPSGKSQTFDDLAVDQYLTISEPQGPGRPVAEPRERTPQLWKALPNFPRIEHHEEPFNDFDRQPLLPNKLSQFGPPVAAGDVDDDGDLDLFVGEGSGWMGMIYKNDGHGRFTTMPQVAFADDARAEDSAAAMADFDGDGDVDLFVASGSVECDPGDDVLRDRLYLNDGHGNFSEADPSWLPDARHSAGTVAAHDFDADGDMDLFVGSRSVPGQYPLAPEHQLLRNEGDHFEDVTAELAPDLAAAGMATAAVWSDVTGDGVEDLIVAVDWGPLRCYASQEGKLVERTDDAGLGDMQGWWCSVAAADIDGDGDQDLVAGNFGLNTKYKASPESPVIVYYGDYGDGKSHLIEAAYEDDVLFPMRGKSCSTAAMPFLRERFPTYEKFAAATLDEVYTPECIENATRFDVTQLASGCFLNDGTGKFEFVRLPADVQLAPVFAIVLDDFDGDGNIDAFLGQNFFSPQSETGEMDGGVSVVALGNGDGRFRPLRADQAGVVLPVDVKTALLGDIDGVGDAELIVACNDGPMFAFSKMSPKNSAQQKSQYRTSLRDAPDIVGGGSDRKIGIKPNLRLARKFLAAGEVDAALPALRRVLKIAPAHIEARLALVDAYRQLSRFAAAQAILDTLRRYETVKADENRPWLLAQGRLLHSMGRFDEAERVLKQAVDAGLRSTAPQDGAAYFFLAENYRRQGRLGDAEAGYRQAVDLGYERANDGLSLTALRRAEARTFYRQALSAEIDGRDVEALALYQRSLKANSRHPSTLNDLARLLAMTTHTETKDLWLALRLAEQAVEINGRKNPSVLDTLAYVYAAAGDFSKATATQREILELPEVKRGEAKLKLRFYMEGRLPPAK